MKKPLIYQLSSGAETGAFNMAVDEILLEHLRGLSQPALIVRTYEWCVPTLSYGVNQPEGEVFKLLERYGYGTGNLMDLVRRPTGGRAILHGEDLSFSFVTNMPELCRLPLKKSYAFLMAFVRTAFESLGVVLDDSKNAESSERAYTLSPICFETKTPSDLLDAQGKKVAGCSQLRRDGGILQHGAAFILPYELQAEHLTQALFKAVASHYGEAYLPSFDLEELVEPLNQRFRELRSESAGILAKASTTTGSHFTPASS